MTSADTFIMASRESLSEGFRKIEHCVSQLSDDQLWWRPKPDMNSIANLLLHLCGNMRQWIISGIGGTKDIRNRPAEFADQSHRPKAELLAKLKSIITEADTILVALDEKQLVAARRIQGFDTHVLTAAFDTIAHFRGHVQEIIHMTRQQLGEKYKFDFVPTGPEQQSAAGPAV
jgi:Protein of unknown function (DUF1572)